MSLLFYVPEKITAKSKSVEPTTTSIIMISVAILVGIIILMYSGLMYIETMMKQYSDCRDKMVGFEQSGIYSSPEQFKTALSYCDVR